MGMALGVSSSPGAEGPVLCEGTGPGASVGDRTPNWGEGHRPMSFYVDAQEQRHKARLAEQRLLEHAERRLPRPGHQASEDEEITTLPPVFRKEGSYDGSRETSLDRRAARFRDTHLYGPPPPPPTPPGDVPRLLPPPRFLVPQHIANAGVTNDPRYAVRSQPSRVLQTPATVYTQEQPFGYQTNEPEPYQRVRALAPPPPEDDEIESEPTPRYRVTPQGLVPYGPLPTAEVSWSNEFLPADRVTHVLIPPDIEEHLQPLTPSQKKRLRRKRSKEQRGSQPPRPAPYPLPQDASPTNGHAPPLLAPPEPLLPAQRAACGAEVLVTLRHAGTPILFRFLCPLTPWPHPGQPHMVKLDPVQDGTEIFLGWWHPGE